MATAYQPWVGSETFIGSGDVNGNKRLDAGETPKRNIGSIWDRVSFGVYTLPGVSTIEGLEIGITCDIQKRKKREKAQVKDLGMNPSRFRVVTEIRSSQWEDWLKILPKILPAEGTPREAFTISHPLVNANGIRIIYVQSIKYDSPSARRGMKISIEVVEWLAEVRELEAKSTKKVDGRAPNHIPDRFGPTHPKNLPPIGPPAPSDAASVYDRMFR